METIKDFLPCPVVRKNFSNNLQETFSFLGFNLTSEDFQLPVSDNRSVNQSCWHFEESPYSTGFKKVMDDVNMYITPIIIIVGICGNLLSFLVFTFTHLRRQSSSVYLASLAVVDIIFLLSLCIVWLSWLRIPLFHRNGFCQIVVYMTYVCTFLSVWLVTSFTVDRFIFCYYPLRKDRFCTTKRARLLVVFLVLCGLITYSFATWTSGVIYLHSVPLCMPYPKYYNVLTTVTAVDSALTLIIPCSLVIVLNIRIVLRIMNVEKQRQPFVRQLQYGVVVHSIERKKSGPTGSICRESLSSGCPMHVRFQNHTTTDQKALRTTQTETLKVPIAADPNANGLVKKAGSRGRGHQYRTARMLIIVSTVFLLLNLPGHIFRIYAFIQSSLHDEFSADRKDLTWHEIFQLVYHLNFSINFFIYSASGRQFRTGLKILYTKFQHKTANWKSYLTCRRLPANL